MERIHHVDERPFADVRRVALAIRSIDAGQRHIGILHRESDRVLLLHLAFHHELRNASPTAAYLWIELDGPDARLRQVAARCRQIWRANNKFIPFAFSPPNDCFDEMTGRFLLGPNRLGLTCASFVLAVFHSVGLPLADLATWPIHRPDDIEWQQHVLWELETSGCATSEQIESIRQKELGAARYRPEEVAGAGTAFPPPAVFAVAAERGQLIVARFDNAVTADVDAAAE